MTGDAGVTAAAAAAAAYILELAHSQLWAVGVAAPEVLACYR